MAPKEEPLADNARPIRSDKKKQKWRHDHKPENDAFVDRALCNEFDAKPMAQWNISDLNRVMNTNEEFRNTLNLMVENNDAEHLQKIMPHFFNGQPVGDLHGPGGDVHRFAHMIEVVFYANDKGWKGAMERFPERTPAADTAADEPQPTGQKEEKRSGGLLLRAHDTDVALTAQGQAGVDAVRAAMAALGVTMDAAHDMKQPTVAAVPTDKAKGAVLT